MSPRKSVDESAEKHGMKKNAGEHNINKVMQELTAAGLHIDNEESFKK